MAETAETDIAWIVVIVAAALCVLACMGYCCILKCWCIGPDTLTRDDVSAMATFMDIYRLQGIEVDESIFQVSREKWLKIRPYKVLLEPISDWGNLYEGEVQGFMVEFAKFINGRLQSFQHDLWQDKGAFAENWPVMVIAQEWRAWSMQELQQLQDPTVAAKEEIRKRLKWIESARNLMSTDIAELRLTPCWDDNDSRSLLLVMRDEIRPLLEMVIDQWESYELQQTFGERLRALKVLLEQNVKSSLRFLEVIIRSNEVRLASRLPFMTNGHPVDEDDVIDVQLCELAKVVDELASSGTVAKRKDETEAAVSTVNSSASSASVSPRMRFKITSFGLDEYMSRWNDRIEHLQPIKEEDFDMNPEEREHYDQLMKAFKRTEYGLNKNGMIRLIGQYVVFHRKIETMARTAVLVRRISRFAQLGGELFLTRALNKDHLLQVLSFVAVALLESRDGVEELGESAQRGWETMRRESKSTSWSSSGPVDNLRLALSAKADIIKTVMEGLELVRDLKGRADKSAAEVVSNDLNQEMETYLEEWEELKKMYGLEDFIVPPYKIVDRSLDKDTIRLPTIAPPPRGRQEVPQASARTVAIRKELEGP